MPHERRWSGRSRKLTALLLSVTVVPAATLIWLGVQLLQQDRSLAAQREQEWRQAAAQSIVHALERSLVASERWLQEDPLPQGMVRVLVSPQGVDVSPRERVLWVNGGPTLPAAEDGRFADAERWEFQGTPDRAVVVYDQAATSPVRTVRAGALVRLARVRRQQRQWAAAIAAYRQLASIADVAVAGAPADLQARRALCAVLEDSGRADAARREAIALQADLLAGRWLLDRATWELTASELQRWTTAALPGSADRLLFSQVASALADAWRDPSLSRSPASVRRIMVTDGAVVTLIARADDRQALFVALAPSVHDAWIGDAVRNRPEANARISLLAPSGQLVAGSAPAEGSNRVRMPAADTNLPWTVVVDADFASPLARELAGRRRLLLVGLAAILLLVGGGGYVLWHLLQRDLAMARLQTDFVAAVSHEFRTPLTSLRHVTELLEESDDLPPDRRKTFYQALGRSTERLHRLVESLLDFSRMEGGRKPYDLRSTDAGLLVGQVVGDFEREMGRRGLSVNLRVEPGDLQINADPQALTHALWNLLDNALKYSPDHQVIDVTVRAQEARVAISVRDRGLGIPLHERKDIFQRFVRGQDASRLGIKGTGLGLAMVSHILRAHGGTIELDSEEGVGSTFTMVLPADAGPRLAKGEEHNTAGSAELTESAHRAR